MSCEEVLVHYVLHNNIILGQDFFLETPNNQLFGTDSKIEILGKLNKQTLLSSIRNTYEWNQNQIYFIKKSSSKLQKLSTLDTPAIFQHSNQLSQKYDFVNPKGEFTIKLIEIFDYSAWIDALSLQKNLNNTQLTQFYLIHLFTTSQNSQSSIIRKITSKRDDIFIGNNRSPGIQLFSAKKFDVINKEMNDHISKTFGDHDQKVRKLIEGQQLKITNLAPTTALVKPGTIGNTPPQTNPSESPKTIISDKATSVMDAKSLAPSVNPKSDSIDIKKVLRVTTTKEEIESTLRLAKVTHRSFHKDEQIKQRSIVDFSSSKIELINAYKNFFYEKQVILKDEMQAKYLKESLNTIDFNLDVGAPSAALDTKIGMALLRTNSLSEQTYLHNQSFSQVHIAYSFEEAFQIQPQNIMLNLSLRNSFKTIFMFYVVMAKTSGNPEQFFTKTIHQIPQIKQQLQLFFNQYGSQLETGVFVFGGKYMAQTSFKFLQNLDLKSKQKVRNLEGNFTIRGGQFDLKPAFKNKQKEQEKSHIATQNAIISRSYILFPGSTKNLTDWNNNLQNSRQDWKLILKDTKKLFIGQILANPLNSQEYKLIDNEAFGNFTKKIKEYFNEVSNASKKTVDEGLQEFKKNRIFVLWKEQVIKTLRVIKLTPLESNQPIRTIEKPIKANNQRTLTDRKFISDQQLRDIKKQTKMDKKSIEKNKQQGKGCFSSKKPSFYIMVRGKQINQVYKSILGESSDYEERREIYDTRFEKWFFKYICCCFFQKKPQLTEVQIRRKKYMTFFSDQKDQRLLRKIDLQMYNKEIESQYKRLQQANEFRVPSQIISCSPKIRHIFDICESNFNEGLIENLVFRTTPWVDCLNRSVRWEIQFWMEFANKRQGLINLLEKGQQEQVIVRVQNIRKVNLVGEVLEQNVEQYGNIFYNRPGHQHFMSIQKLANIGR